MNRKTGLCFLICVMCCLLLAGCKKKQEVFTEPFQRIEIESFSRAMKEKHFETYEIVDMIYRSGKQYVVVEGYQHEEIQRFIYQIQGDEVVEWITLPVSKECQTNAVDVDENGNVYLLEERYDEIADKSGEYLLIMDREGKKLSEQEIGELISANDIVTELQLGIQNEIYLFCDSGTICVLNTLAELQYCIENHVGERILEVTRMKDESVIFVSAEYSGEKENLNVYQIQHDEKNTKRIVKLEEEVYGTNILINGVEPYDFYLRDNHYISGYSVDEKKMTPIMDWEENDFVADMTDRICVLTEKQWIALEQDTEPILVYMQQGQPETGTQAERLYLACLYSDSVLHKQVADFNRESKSYQIDIISYDEKEDPFYSFLMDLTTGKEIDIIMLPSEQQELLQSKGVLEDLYPYIEKDWELEKEDFLPNVLSAYEQDGKLLHTISRVNVSGWLTKKSYLGENDTWNLMVFQKMLEEHPNALLFREASGEKILGYFLDGMSGSLVDWEKGTCDFQSDAFYNMLDIAKQYGKQKESIPLEEVVEEVKKEALLFSETILNPFEVELYDTALNGDFTAVGPPFAGENGRSFINSDIQYGISVNSGNKDGAWEFVRTYFTAEYQDLGENIILFGMDTDGFPVRKDCFEEYVKRYTAVERYEKDGQWIEPIQGQVGTSVLDFEAKPLTTEQEKMFRKIVSETMQKQKKDTQISKIILEDAQAYFDDEKTMEQAAEIMQNRINLYLNENR